MSRTLRHPVLQWLVYGHLWLALGITAQVWWIGQFLTDAPEFWRYILAAGCGTVAAYSLMRWVRSRDPHLIASEHLQWVRERRIPVLVLSVVCCLVAAVLCWPLQWHIIRWLLPAGFIAVLYVSPFSGKDGQAIGLRQVPGLKVLLIAFVCVTITVAVPMAYDEVGHSTAGIVLMMCMRLPLFMAISIAFDIRDTAFDPPSLRTIPQLLGVRGAKTMAILLLISSALFEHVFLRGLGYATSAFIAMLGYAVAIMLVAFAKPHQGPLFYGLLLDGVLVLLPVCMWLGM
jgi:4-hydroxybenzoate polyprenyltransferase